MIEKERIEAAKGVDLVGLIKSRGIELKKKGKGYVGLCPFHTEETPSFSVNPAQNLWQCFGCGTGGDAIRPLCQDSCRLSWRDFVLILWGTRKGDDDTQVLRRIQGEHHRDVVQ